MKKIIMIAVPLGLAIGAFHAVHSSSTANASDASEPSVYDVATSYRAQADLMSTEELKSQIRMHGSALNDCKAGINRYGASQADICGNLFINYAVMTDVLKTR